MVERGSGCFEEAVEVVDIVCSRAMVAYIHARMY
jgi:hypothetical protein